MTLTTPSYNHASASASSTSSVRDVQNKLNTNAFMRQQLVECEKVFVEKFQKGLAELKKALEPEVVEAEVEA